MLKKWYDKSKLGFALPWIAAYCVLMSVGDTLSAGIGIEKSVTLVIGLALSAILLGFLTKHGLASANGLCRPACPARAVFWYLPLILMMSANLWFGMSLRLGAAESVLAVLTMLCVGFLEEVIFRGLLYGAMVKDSPRAAVIVSSLTFGIGHLVNLINGSGAGLLPGLLQVVYAASAGFLFVMIYKKSGSLLVCIGAHGLFNALGVFANEAPGAAEQILSCLLLTAITGTGAWLLARRGKEFIK